MEAEILKILGLCNQVRSNGTNTSRLQNIWVK